MIRIRFVSSNALSSELIRLQAGVSMPFTPSHTEALSQDGKFYIGAQNDGVQKLPVGYDDGKVMKLPDGRDADIIVSLPCSQEQEDAFYTFINSKIGEPYDWMAIAGFIEGNRHTPDHIICSAFMTYGLRKADYFPKPLTVPFHHVSPRDLLLMLSTHVEIPH